MALNYPITLNFKLIALAPRIRVTDASGQLILYVHQKTLALKEHIKIYRDEQKQQQLYEIKADRILDFSARYHFRDMQGNEIGSIKHRGMRSIWKATYEIANPGSEEAAYSITEDNPWVKVADALLGEIPVAGMFTGYFFNPKYTVKHIATGAPVLALTKKPAFFESNFTIDRLDDRLDGMHELRLLLGVLMMVQMERSRG